MNWEPSDENITHYRESGWFVTPTIIPEELLEKAEADIYHYYEGIRDYELPEWTRQFDWKPEDGNILRLNNYISLQLKSVSRLISHPAVAQTAAILAGSPAIRLYKDSSIFKPPIGNSERSKVGWHTDRSYWRMCSSSNMLTAWIPFKDSDPTNGSLSVISGSHQMEVAHNLRTFGNQETDEFEDTNKNLFDPDQKKGLVVKRGQISFHDCRLLHASFDNKSSSDRLVLAVHLQPDENRYQRVLGDNGEVLSHLNDYICRKTDDGNPDYTDPSVFPELWRDRKISTKI